MRITCPNCAAAYEVPEARIAGARQVRCAQCGSGWTPMAAAAAPVAPPVTVSAPAVTPLATEPEQCPKPDLAPLTAATTPVAAPKRRGLDVGLAAAWAASLAALCLLAWAMAAWRLDIMRAWPPSERLYAALGLVDGARGR